MKWLMEKHELWEYVLDGDTFMMTATVDGGTLAWKLTQVPASIKFYDKRTINPLTGRNLFGATGFDNVQSRSVCFPLFVCIEKDDRQFIQPS